MIVDPVDAEGAQFPAHMAVADQVPVAPAVAERVGVNLAVGFDAGEGMITDQDPAVMRHAIPQGRHELVVGGVVPGSAGQDDQALLGAARFLAQVVRQDVVQLGGDPRRRVLEGLAPEIGHQPRAHIEDGRFFGGEDQRGEFVAAQEGKAAIGSALRIERDAQFLQHVDIAVNRSLGDIQLPGKLPHRPVPSGLEEEEHREKTRGDISHGRIIPAEYGGK